MDTTEPMPLDKLRVMFPSVAFEHHADPECVHPKSRRFMAGWNEVCGRCGRARSVA